MNSTAHDFSLLFVELGSIVVGLALLARWATKWGFSSIPLYLLAGLAFGNGGILPLNLSKAFIAIGAEIGVLLLLFMLGLEYSGAELGNNVRTGLPTGVMDFVLNFPPGYLTGYILGWRPLAAVLMGGVTWISSSGIVAKVLSDLGRLSWPETPTVLSVLVIEDLAMALYLPTVAVLLVGGSASRVAFSVTIAIVTVAIVLVLAIRYGETLSRFAAHESDEIILLTSFGTVLLVGGIAQRLQVSSAIGAFLVGIALSGPIAEQSHRLIAPLRDLFAATFFFFFGLQIDPASLPPVLWLAIVLGVTTAATKIATGYWGAGRHGVDHGGRIRAGMELVARGEFSIVIAGLGARIEPAIGPLSAAYVLFLAILGPFLARFAE